jgi:CRP-like cAMP-binding protein
LSAILKRAAQQTASTLVQQAISQLPRVEDRLLALMRTIAQREGVARPDGIFIALAATHDTLAHMIGAQRPTVSLGLAHLAEEGRLRPEPDGWTLASDELGPSA